MASMDSMRFSWVTKDFHTGVWHQLARFPISDQIPSSLNIDTTTHRHQQSKCTTRMFPCPSSHGVLHPCKTFQDSCQILCFPLDPRLSVLACAFITDCQGTILPFLKSLKDNDCTRGPLRLSKAMPC